MREELGHEILRHPSPDYSGYIKIVGVYEGLGKALEEAQITDKEDE